MSEDIEHGIPTNASVAAAFAKGAPIAKAAADKLREAARGTEGRLSPGWASEALAEEPAIPDEYLPDDLKIGVDDAGVRWEIGVDGHSRPVPEGRLSTPKATCRCPHPDCPHPAPRPEDGLDLQDEVSRLKEQNQQLLAALRSIKVGPSGPEIS